MPAVRLDLDRNVQAPMTHDLGLAKHVSDSVVFLDHGRVYAEDRIENLLERMSDPVINKFFCGDD